MKRNKKSGFTLAEILITLSIIGVVAALTIPTLIQRTGNEELVSRLMKAYSTLSQATEAIMTENGGVKTWAYSTDNIYELYKSHLRNARDCGSGKGCFSQEIKYLNGNGYHIFDNVSETRKLILSDGTQLYFWRNVDTSCNMESFGSLNVCSGIDVDINGQKTPNTAGRDVFSFVLKETGLYPRGCDDEEAAECNSEGHGRGCACRVIQEGRIDY